MRPTQRAIVLVGVAFACAVAAERFRNLALLSFAIAIGSLLVVSLLQVLLGSSRTWSFSRSLSPSPAFVGDQLRVRLVGEAAHWWSPSVIAEEELRERRRRRIGFATSRRRRSAAAVWGLDAEHRGLLVSGPSQLWRYDLARLFRKRCGSTDSTSVIVRPRTVALNRRMLLRAAERERATTATERSEERGDLRPYVAGDDPRRVNWKATAKAAATGTDLIVSVEDRQRTDEDLRVLLSLDRLPAGRGNGVPTSPFDPINPDRELALSAAASILLALDGQGSCNLEIRIGTEVLHSSRLLRENLDALALVERLESPEAVPESTGLAASFARNERRPHFVITGPGARADGRVHLVCDTGAPKPEPRRSRGRVRRGADTASAATPGGDTASSTPTPDPVRSGPSGPNLVVANLDALEQALG